MIEISSSRSIQRPQFGKTLIQREVVDDRCLFGESRQGIPNCNSHVRLGPIRDNRVTVSNKFSAVAGGIN